MRNGRNKFYIFTKGVLIGAKKLERIEDETEHDRANQSDQDLLTHRWRQSDYRRQIFESKIGSEDPFTDLDPYLSPENVARFLDVSRKFVYELMARREIESISVGGRLKRIRLSALESWLGRHNKRRKQA